MWTVASDRVIFLPEGAVCINRKKEPNTHGTFLFKIGTFWNPCISSYHYHWTAGVWWSDEFCFIQLNLYACLWQYYPVAVLCTSNLDERIEFKEYTIRSWTDTAHPVVSPRTDRWPALKMECCIIAFLSGCEMSVASTASRRCSWVRIWLLWICSD